MEVITLIYILFIHWVADFIFQSDYMAQNKSKDNKALLVHGFVYHIPFWLISPLYAIVNGIIHAIIDFVTSRITSKLYSKMKFIGFLQ